MSEALLHSFPDGFLWGVATSGHQTEGDNVTSDTWFLEQQSPSVFREPSGKACDSWERWRDDLALTAGFGCNAVRFSVEWARVEPEPGAFSSSALDHYEAMVDRCHELGLAPVVTFNHFTNPHWFAARAGWFAPDAADRFATYCAQVMRRFGDRIAFAVTLNEPNLPRVLDWLGLPPFIRDLERATLAAAAASAGVERYCTGNVTLPEEADELRAGQSAGHLAARAAIKAVRSDLPVGLSLAMIDDVAVGDDAGVRDRKRADCYEPWLALAAGDDFLGVQNYERAYYDASGPVQPDGDGERNQFGSAIVPDSLAAVARYAHERAGVPLFVTEHGIATPDDAQRCRFVPAALASLSEVIADGVPVIGYTHWSLLDNFEWIFGYEPRFGLVELDRDTFARTPKPSAAVYAAIVRANGVA